MSRAKAAIGIEAVHPRAHFIYFQDVFAAGVANTVFQSQQRIIGNLPTTLTRRKLYWSLIVDSGTSSGFKVVARLVGAFKGNLKVEIPFRFGNVLPVAPAGVNLRIGSDQTPVSGSNNGIVDDEPIFAKCMSTANVYQIALPLRVNCTIDAFGWDINEMTVPANRNACLFVAVYSEGFIGKQPIIRP